MRDVPRNARGWPTIPPAYFTLPQLIREAEKWCNHRGRETVGGEQWRIYTNELMYRGFSTETEILQGILPHEVQRKEKPSWWSQMEE